MNTVQWNQNRQTIYAWMINHNLASFAETYKGAVFILHDKTPGHVRFVAHAVRDLMNGMAATKLGCTRVQVGYVNLVNDLNSQLKKSGFLSGQDKWNPTETVDNPETHVLLPKDIWLCIQALLQRHNEGRQRSEDSTYEFFQVFIPSSVAKDSIPESHLKMWKALHSWFLSRCHENGTLPDAETVNQIESKFSQLESILLSVADRFSNTIKTLDEILDTANS